jgi:hypothetical protein
MSKKVIFLDNDGVICLAGQWGGRSKKQKKYQAANGTSTVKEMPVECRFDNFDPKAIKVLNKIIEETDAELVVSSDWRLHANLQEIQSYYLAQGIVKGPIDFTPVLGDFDEASSALYYWKGWNGRARILEIRKWLELNKVDKWVAVDDIPMGLDYEPEGGLENFVHTPSSTEGIKKLGIANKIISILNEA